MFLQCIMAIAAFEHQSLTPTPASADDRFAPPAHWWLLVRHCLGIASTLLKWQDRVKKADMSGLPQWVRAALRNIAPPVIVIDGKTLRHSCEHTSNKATIHMVSASTTEKPSALFGAGVKRNYG